MTTLALTSLPAVTPATPGAKKKLPSGYTGPLDGGSHYDEKVGPWLHRLNKVGMAAVARVHVQGRENIPETGSSMLCFNHQSYTDPPLVASLSDRDWRFMAAVDQFTGLAGKAMTALGAFPVDRGANPSRPLDVAKGLLDSGKGVGIFPEGGIFRDGSVHPLKEGTAMIALRSQCQTVVPGAIRYEKHAPTLGERVKSYASAAAVTTGAVACAVAGGPVLVASMAVTGLVTGVVAGSASGAVLKGLHKDIKEVAQQALQGGLIGAVAGVTVGVLGAAVLGNPLLVAVPLAGVTGLATLALGKALSHRVDAYVTVGAPIEVEPYRQLPPKEGRRQLTADLHAAMVALKDGLDKS